MDEELVAGARISGDIYELKQIPLCAYRLSFKDLVYAPLDPAAARPTFQYVLSNSGNRTLRALHS